MKNLNIVRYSENYKSTWNQFIANSKNGLLLFNRDYMDYHSDRFQDFSLMFFEGNNLIAVFPANIESNILFSHSGLTYGGIISDYQIKIADMIELFDSLKEYLTGAGIKRINYKALPYIYHVIPAQEDLYALYVNKASLTRRDFSACVNLQEKPCQNKNKITRNISRAIKSGLEVKRSYDFKSFWTLLEQVLREKYNTKPAHSIEEIEILVGRFPEEIKLYSTYKDDILLAGSVIYESNQNVAHMQYQSISEEGKKYFALDYLYHTILDIYRPKVKFFNFGSSIIRETNRQNLDLMRYKESLGARIVHHDTYELELVLNHTKFE